MKNETKLWLELNCPKTTHVKSRVADRYFDYFINKNINKPVKVDEEFVESMADSYDISLIQQMIANILFENNSSPSSVLKEDFQLYIDREAYEDYDSTISLDDEEDESSYCLGLNTYIAFKTTDNKDFIIKISTDPYDSCDPDCEDAELISCI